MYTDFISLFQLPPFTKQHFASTYMDYSAHYKVKILSMQYTRDGSLVPFFNTITVFPVLQLHCSTPICFSFLGKFLENIAVQAIQLRYC